MKRDLQYYFDNKKLNHKVFNQIYNLSARQLYGVIFRILKDKEKSEECLQEVFVKVYNNFDSYDSNKAKALTWMVTITRNYTIDFARKKQLDIVDDFDLSVISDSQIQVLQEIENSENKKILEKCLKQLKGNSKHAVYYFYYSGITYDEIAKNFNTSTNTAKSWVHRALPKLKSCFEKYTL